MKSLKRLGIIVAVIVLLLVAGWIGYQAGNRHDRAGVSTETAFMDATDPVATVQIAPLERKRIEEKLDAYGTVIVAPGKSQTFSVPFECRVKNVLVTEGQRVTGKTAMLIVEPSPDTELRYQEAMNQLSTAREQLKLTQNLVNLQLATKQDLATLQAEVHSLELKVKSFKNRGVDGERTLRAGEAGLVSSLRVQQGEIVPAGNVLIETVSENDIQVRLGVESEDIGHVSEGQTVVLHHVNVPGDSAIDAVVMRVTHRVNPDTRLIDVYVRPRQADRLLLHDYIWGQIVAASSEALVVPRSAVLPSEDGYVLYTVSEGKAHAHKVQVGIENRNEYEVLAKGLQPGEQVVVVGNLELEDGMSVNVDTAK